MNSSSSSSNSDSNSNNNNGFSGFNEMNPVLGFNSPALTGSGKNLSRPRLTKLRKQTNSYKSNGNNNNDYRIDSRVLGADQGLGFSQFRGSESVFGNLGSGNVGNSFGSNVIVDDMTKLKIDDDKRFDNVMKKKGAFGVVDSLMVDELPKEISKMTIEGESNVGNVKNDNLQDFGKSDNNNVAAVEIENEMKNLNLKDHKDATLFGPASFTSTSDRMAEFVFTSKLDDIGAPFAEFKTPDMKGNMFSGFNRFEARKESVKDTRLKKKKGKLRTPVVGPSRVREGFGFSRRSLSGDSDAFEAYSPMDISPCDQKVANNNCSSETSVTSDDASQNNDQFDGSSEPHLVTSNVTTDDESVEPYINEVSETESFKSATENLDYSSDTFVTAIDSDVTSSTATYGRQESVFSFASKSENVSKGNFTFAASSSSQSHLPSDIRHKKKLPLKIVRDSYSSTSAEFFPFSGSSPILSPGNGLNVDLSTLHKKKDNIIPVSEQDFRHENVITMSSSKLAEEACEKWRLRGNQAYGNGDLAKADDCYTQGINSVPQNEKSKNCLRALMLCYSNRAATRISLGRMKEALSDCLMADTIDPNFLKVQVRVAHCYLALGETENAKKQYEKCLQSRTNSSVDKKVIAEASEGLEKTQKVLECIKKCTDLFQRRASEDFECALRVISEALQISTCSEKLLQMKAEALFMLRRYEQVIQVCERTLASDEANTSTNSWKPHLIVKAYFYLGRLDDALQYINKHGNSGLNAESVGNKSQESAIPLADTIRELLSHKTAGNEAYKSGKHAEAVEHYTAALSCNVESRPFASVCFCNRAAAYRCLGQVTDAIADCSLAIALDPHYLKAISRRASLYEMIRDYGQALKDLQRVVSLLTTQVKEKGDLSGVSEKLSLVNEIKQTQLQLANVEEKSRKGIPLNMYIILGVDSTASAPDIKKAYRKAALRHHPDKAAQSLVRSDDGDDGLWKEIAENVYKDADRLFKMIGEAYAVLSNPSKRSRYDEDEEMRNEGSKFTRSKSSRMATDVQNSVFERSESRRQWQDSHRYSKHC